MPELGNDHLTNGYKCNCQLVHINIYFSQLVPAWKSSSPPLTGLRRWGRCWSGCRRSGWPGQPGSEGEGSKQLWWRGFKVRISVILSILRGTEWHEMCSLVLNQTWNFLRRWLGWRGRGSRSPPTRPPRARSPSHQRPAGSRGGQGCFSSNGWQTFTTSKNEIWLARFCKEQQRSWFKMRTKHVLTGADAPIWGGDEMQLGAGVMLPLQHQGQPHLHPPSPPPSPPSPHLTSIKVNLTSIGWDFIVAPEEIDFSFCRGHCDPFQLPNRIFVPQFANIRYVSWCHHIQYQP